MSESPRLTAMKERAKVDYGAIGSGGRPLSHVLRVSRRGRTERQRVVGLWHRAIADGAVTTHALVSLLTVEEAGDVLALNLFPGDNPYDHVTRICAEASNDALFVAMFGLLDELDPIRLGSLNDFALDQKFEALRDIGNALRTTTGRGLRRFIDGLHATSRDENVGFDAH